VYEEDHAAFWRLADEAYRKQRTGAQMDFRYVRADNTRIWFHIHLMYLQEKDGHKLFYASLSRATELEKRFLNEKLLSTLQMASLNSWEWDLQKNELKVINTSGQEEFAKISSKLIKDRNVFPFSAETMFEKHLIEPGYEPEVRKHVFHIFECSDQERVAFDIPFRLRDGGKLWLTFTGQVHCAPDGRPVRVIGFYKNITESRKKDEELQRKAEHDALTGLYNRYYAVPWIEDYLKSHNAKQSALAMIDLDHFKDINDTFGHVRGDEVITDIARKVEKVFRESDIVCRMGGDEFMIFCGNIREKDFEKQLQNAIDTLQLSVRENNREIMVSVSVGYVLLHQSDGSFSDLYEKADQALLKAKDLGKNRFVRYDIG
jgi:diguanylate cyclase (GGDEF)-like protein